MLTVVSIMVFLRAAWTGLGGRPARVAAADTFRAAFRFETSDLLRQFAEGVTDLIEHHTAAGRQAIHPRAFQPLGFRGTQPSAPGHPRENRIERARAQAIAVVLQFLEHPVAIDTLLLSVMKDMNFPENEEKLAHDGIAHAGMIAVEGSLLQQRVA